MKKIFILLFATCTVVGANAQTTINRVIKYDQSGVSASDLGSLPEQIELEDVLAELTYDYNYLIDTTDHTKVKSDMMLVQVGASASKYFSYRSMVIDSLINIAPIEEIMNNPAKYAKNTTEEIYKNYPEGKITTIDCISVNWVRCIEKIPQFEWELKEETKEIMGYNCRRAEWSYGGRHWIAWYTDEIPVSVGPWKLDGLPGAIVEAGDSEGHYTFKLIGVKMNPERKMTLTDTKFVDTSLKQYYNTKRKYIENPLGGLAADGMNVTIINQSTGKPMTEADLIKKMKYDFIERF
ncbi:MAG: GLPGLI family protein [Rikenellaceae bacterium]